MCVRQRRVYSFENQTNRIFCVFYKTVFFNFALFRINLPLVIPLGGLPALAQLALLVAHHVEVPLLAVRVPARRRMEGSTRDWRHLVQLWNTSSRSSSMTPALDASPSATHSPLKPTLPEKKQRQMFLHYDTKYPQDRHTVLPRTGLHQRILLRNPAGGCGCLVVVAGP